MGQFRVSSSSPNIAVTLTAQTPGWFYSSKDSQFFHPQLFWIMKRKGHEEITAQMVLFQIICHKSFVWWWFFQVSAMICRNQKPEKQKANRNTKNYIRLLNITILSVFCHEFCNGTMANSVDPGEKNLPAEQPWLHPSTDGLACKADVAITSLGWMKAMVWTLWNPSEGVKGFLHVLGNALGSKL